MRELRDRRQRRKPSRLADESDCRLRRPCFSALYSPPQLRCDLQALRRQSQILLEKAASNTQLNEALGQIEELQRELGREKEERALKERELQDELHQLQESNLIEENKSEWWSLNQFNWCVEQCFILLLSFPSIPLLPPAPFNLLSPQNLKRNCLC